MKLQYDQEHSEQYLAAAIIAYQGALGAAVRMLADANGTDDMSWFDDLREDATQAAKGTVTEQVPKEVEAGAIRFGLQAVGSTFETLRAELVEDE